MNEYSQIDRVLQRYHYDSKALVNILQEVQETCKGRYISEATAEYVAERLDVTKSNVYEVVTFFAALREHPVGEVLIQLCNSTVCKVKKNIEVKNALEEALGIQMGETTKDKKFTLQYTTCFGACDVSPAVRVNKVVYGNLDRETTLALIAKLRREHCE
ncbi:MAG: NAD(P)H-dependent oxidoreductase subunit E [Clostridia bacterium]|nr:NAD(P)H-dependent oxidoreductase subunit E [Clostridia bacterium]